MTIIITVAIFAWTLGYLTGKTSEWFAVMRYLGRHEDANATLREAVIGLGIDEHHKKSWP